MDAVFKFNYTCDTDKKRFKQKTQYTQYVQHTYRYCITYTTHAMYQIISITNPHWTVGTKLVLFAPISMVDTSAVKDD